MRQAAQEQLWAQQRAMREQASLQPLSTCVAELRRWQGVQRAAHEHKCSQLRGRRNAEEGDLQWRIFCARLAHDSCGALCVVPLTPEQIRYCDSAASQQLQPRSKAKDPKIFTVVRGGRDHRCASVHGGQRWSGECTLNAWARLRRPVPDASPPRAASLAAAVFDARIGWGNHCIVVAGYRSSSLRRRVCCIAGQRRRTSVRGGFTPADCRQRQRSERLHQQV